MTINIGTWSDEMLLLFNRIGSYCEENVIDANEAEQMFSAGIVARVKGTLPLVESPRLGD